MTPLSLQLHNFLSYGENVPPLDLASLHVACLSGDNGAGKSALLDAMTYALWGEARKGEGERRPDAGLLRRGATEMRVELCFGLKDDRYRVIRSYRRRKRDGVSQLELQVFEPEQETYRTLSSGKLRDDQEHINQLLAMDYETFTNSAFLVQGRADEFTRRTAGRRKEILAEILGLSRYDRLQEEARQRHRDYQKAAQDHARRLEELGAELAHRDEYARRLKDIDARLSEASAALEADEKKLEALRADRTRAEQIHRQLDEVQRERQRLTEALEEAQHEIEHLRSQQELDAKSLQNAAAIERDFAEFQQLVQNEAAQRQKSRQHQDLEKDIRRLEGLITDARHKVEQRRTEWQSRCQGLQVQLERYQELLDQEQTIRTQYALLEAARTQETALETQRQRHEELSQDTQRQEALILAERQQLEVRLAGLRERCQPLRQRLEELPQLKSRHEALSTQIAQMAPQVAERDELKEKGSAIGVRLDHISQSLQQAEAEAAKLDERVALLKDADEAQCPLCGSDLDEHHRSQLDDELARQQAEKRQQRAEQEQRIADEKAQLQQMRDRYKQLEQLTRELPERQREAAALQERLNAAQREAADLEALNAQIAALEKTLADEDFAAQARQRLARIAEEVQRLNYAPQRHQSVRDDLERLATAAKDHARLEAASQQTAALRADLAAATERRDLAQRYLDEKLYAQEENTQLEAARQALADLGYDPQAHAQARERMDELSDAVARLERLNAARQRHESAGEALEKKQAQAQTWKTQTDELAQRQTQLQEQDKALEGIEARCDQLAADLITRRRQRDDLLRDQASLSVQLERCQQLEKQRQNVKAQYDTAQKEIWAYQQLDRAFGRDGIQALIIENAIPEIESEANALLARLTDNRIQISIESLKDLRTGGTSETLDIRIADEVGERSYHLYSGGEAFRTNFALRLALSKVLAKRAGAQLRTLIIDEGFGTQDSRGLEQLVEAIQAISPDFDKLLVVTHLDALKNAFPTRIEVKKHPDLGSRFAIVESE